MASNEQDMQSSRVQWTRRRMAGRLGTAGAVGVLAACSQGAAHQALRRVYASVGAE